MICLVFFHLVFGAAKVTTELFASKLSYLKFNNVIDFIFFNVWSYSLSSSNERNGEAVTQEKQNENT